MRRCLLLNSSYEAVRVITAQSAVLLIIMEDAEAVEPSPEDYHSAGGLVINVPNVLRLLQYKKIPARTRVPITKRYVLARDQHRCAYCFGPATEVDHVIPRSRGGRHSWTNVVASCRKENAFKADRLLSEMPTGAYVPLKGAPLWELTFEPSTPKGKLFLATVGVTDPSWMPYLPKGLYESQGDKILAEAG